MFALPELQLAAGDEVDHPALGAAEENFGLLELCMLEVEAYVLLFEVLVPALKDLLPPCS